MRKVLETGSLEKLGEVKGIQTHRNTGLHTCCNVATSWSDRILQLETNYEGKFGFTAFVT